MDNEIDQTITDTISSALSKLDSKSDDFIRKFEQRIKLQLLGQLREADLVDLIDAVPLPSGARNED